MRSQNEGIVRATLLLCVLPQTLSKTRVASPRDHFGGQLKTRMSRHLRKESQRSANGPIQFSSFRSTPNLDVRAVEAPSMPSAEDTLANRQLGYPLDVLVVGGGIGGLTVAKTLVSAGANVKVTEKANLETIKMRAAGGPIQLASNALGVLQKIDPVLFEKIQAECTVTGTRTNGLKDGQTGKWYTLFDTKTAATERNLPPSAVIDRPDLQQLLIEDLDGRVECGKSLVSYENLPEGRVLATFDDGTTEKTDLLIGADGIWSKVRAQMHNVDPKSATYSGFTVFAGICDFVPPDIKDVGYKVFMGKAKYFVATDIGKGRMQWYAFLGQRKDTKTPEKQEAHQWLSKEVFADWTPEIKELIEATDPEMVEHRDLYDRPPQVGRPWSDGNVALIGDAIHPMMPNLGQGGCMAIEDAYVLADELAKVDSKADVSKALRSYQGRRQFRTAIVQGLSRFGAEMLLRYFDHPARLEMKGGFPQIVNFGYFSLLMSLWKVLKVLDASFVAQFSYLFQEP